MWPLIAWLLFSTAAMVVAVLNVHASVGAVRTVRPGERALRAVAAGDLLVQVPIAIWLMVICGAAAGANLLAFRMGMHLVFADVASLVMVAVVFAAAVGIPALHAFLTLVGRSRTLRALRGGEERETDRIDATR